MLTMEKIFTLFFTMIFFLNLGAQTTVIKSSSDTLYHFKNDSLFISADSVITLGQKLIVGEGSGENGWYKSIGFKSAFAWPLWLFRSSELDNTYYQQDGESIRELDKVKNYLSPHQELEVMKIRKKGNKRRGYTYIVYLRNKSFPGLNFSCNIKLALKTKEIFMQ